MSKYKHRRNRENQRATLLQHSIFNLQDAEHARPPPSTTTQEPAGGATHHGNGRTSSPKALTSRSIHQLRRAGSKAEEGPSAGELPQAPSAPDLGPAPHRLTGGGQIFNLQSTNTRSSSLQAPLQISSPPTTSHPPTPEKAPAGQGSSQPLPSKTTSGTRGSCGPTKRDRKSVV